jgi:hypothetical protein
VGDRLREFERQSEYIIRRICRSVRAQKEKIGKVKIKKHENRESKKNW